MRCRRGEFAGITVGLVPGFVQCNLVVLPRSDAEEFRGFCAANPQTCPIIDQTSEPENWRPMHAAPSADLRTDLPKYTVYRNGVREQDITDVTPLWRDDFVAFLLGSSLSFDYLLERAGITGVSSPRVMRTAVPTRSVGRFGGNVVVTMRHVPHPHVEAVRQLTAQYPKLHGGPIHIGSPEAIGAVYDPVFNSRPYVADEPGCTPMFWACGVTAQVAAEHARCEIMITHYSGCGFVTDLHPDVFRVA
jgi:uncharacterized protein YcsI (UPF0317 family)